jgi:DNA-directed RNA polymerase subunit RPC12/RpoP
MGLPSPAHNFFLLELASLDDWNLFYTGVRKGSGKNMLDIIMIPENPSIKCLNCDKKATTLISWSSSDMGVAYCPHCGDNILLKVMKKCINAIQEAEVKVSILPKGVIRAREESTKTGIAE